MLKLALNKYERYLINLPPGKTLSDPRLQGALDRLKAAKAKNVMAESIKLYGTKEPAVQDNIAQYRRQAADQVWKNRNNTTGNPKLRIDSPFKTNKEGTKALTNDVLGRGKKNLTGKLRKVQDIQPGTLPKDPNRYLSKALSYMKKKPIKAGLIGAGVGVTLGAVGYGVKKDLES